MSPDGLTALRASIKYWESVVAGQKEATGRSACPLCCYYGCLCYRPEGESEVCPVAIETAKTQCHGSPFYAYTYHMYQKYRHRPHLVQDNEDRELAQAELDFLRNLLPDEERRVCTSITQSIDVAALYTNLVTRVEYLEYLVAKAAIKR